MYFCAFSSLISPCPAFLLLFLFFRRIRQRGELSSAGRTLCVPRPWKRSVIFATNGIILIATLSEMLCPCLLWFIATRNGAHKPFIDRITETAAHTHRCGVIG